MNTEFLNLLACPRCQGSFRQTASELHCTKCSARFPVVDDIPRLNDGATERDPKIAAEWEAQKHAKPLYLDDQSIVNHLETLVLPRIIDWLEDVDGPVLDLGCGVGYLGRAWARQTKVKNPLVALDLQVALLDDAGAGYLGRVEGDVHRLPLKDASFSAVVVANALHHMSDPVRALSEAKRIVKPGGKIVSCDPREFAVLEIIKRALRKNDKAYTEYHRAFRLAEYKGLFESAGLSVERLAMTDPLGPLVATGLDMLKVGKLGFAAPAAKVLREADKALDRLNPMGLAGFTVIAEARRA